MGRGGGQEDDRDDRWAGQRVRLSGKGRVKECLKIMLRVRIGVRVGTHPQHSAGHHQGEVSLGVSRDLTVEARARFLGFQKVGVNVNTPT